MNAAQRKLRARLGGLATKAAGTVNVAPSHAAFLERFIDQVDPDRTLPEPERMDRALAARKLWMNKLSLKSSIARSKKRPASVFVPSEAGPEDRRVSGEPHRPAA